jgi:hypothetical protein
MCYIMVENGKTGRREIMEIPIRNGNTQHRRQAMNQNTTFDPRTGLKIAKPCYYEKNVATRAGLKVAMPCEYTKAKPMDEAHQINAAPGRVTACMNSPNSFDGFTLLLAIILVPIAFAWYVLRFFILPVFEILYHVAFLTCIAHR